METLEEVFGLAGSLLLALPFFLSQRRRRRLRGFEGLTANDPATRRMIRDARDRHLRDVLALTVWESRAVFAGCLCLVGSFGLGLIDTLT